MVVGRNTHTISSPGLLAIGISSALVFMLGLFGLNIIPPAVESSAATYDLPVTAAASVGVTLDKSTLDLGTATSQTSSGSNTATVNTNSVAGYTITQTFDDAAETAATASASSDSAAGGKAKWTPAGSLKLDKAGATNTISVTASHSFGAATKATDSTSGAQSYNEANTFTYTVQGNADSTSTPAGTYKATSKYSVVANLPAAPTGLALSPTEYKIGSADKTLKVTATSGLNAVYSIYIGDSSQACTIDNATRTDTAISCTIPDTITKGEYDVYLISQASAEPQSASKLTVTKPSVCRNADSESECTVDIDVNMIPIKYAGDPNGDVTPKWVVADTTKKGDWYDYGAKQWANAVTVKADALSKYKGATSGTTVDNNDVLGYFVYVPRYAYEVQRRDAVDKNVDAQNFDIHFETVKTAKSIPATCSGSSDTAHSDYRTTCATNNASSRTYHGIAANASGVYDQTTWATHPAFTWGDTELNGFWMGKFETTGKIGAPTVKPNQVANIRNTIGQQFTSAASIGVDDPTADTMGSTVSGTTKNSHNLLAATSHMLKNSEWGAAAYLSASEFGAGVNNVRNNGIRNSNSNTDADGNSANSYGGAATGCGPQSENNDNSTSQQSGVKPDATTFENDGLCETSSSDTTHAYNQTLGVKASTTNNVYGIYDMAGGMWEYVMGSGGSGVATTGTSSTSYVSNAIKSPYVDTYAKDKGFGTKPSWSSSTSEYLYNNDVCTWDTCGGSALHETKTAQTLASGTSSWGSDYSGFVDSGYPWVGRGGGAGGGSGAGVFASDGDRGNASGISGFRVGLLVRASSQ